MTPELLALLGSIAGGTGALLSYWAGWRARGAQRPPYSSAAIDWDAEEADLYAKFIDPSMGTPWDEGRIIRGNGSSGPTTPKPDIIPKPQFPPPRLIREDFLP
jgi:hypothetical protein